MNKLRFAFATDARNTARSPQRQLTAPLALVFSAVLSTPLCLAQSLHVPAQYPTIQQAVDAAHSGQRIVIAAGVYEEQVIIDGKNLRLIGQPGAVIQSPSTLAPFGLPNSPLVLHPVLVALNADSVDLDGLTFDGLQRGDTIVRLTGALYADVGGTIRDCRFTGFRSSSLGSGPGITERAIQMVNILPSASGEIQVREFDVLDCTFDNNRDALYVSGSPFLDPTEVQVRTKIEGNTITGLGPQPLQTEQGILLNFGVTGQVKNNTITDHVFLGQGGYSLALAVGTVSLTPVAPYARPRVLIEGNTITNNTLGILGIHADRLQIVRNTVTGGPFSLNAIAAAGDNVKIVNNTIVMGSVLPGNSGVLLLGAEFNNPFNTGFATNARIIGNTITGAAIPVLEQTGVTGTVANGNIILP